MGSGAANERSKVAMMHVIKLREKYGLMWQFVRSIRPWDIAANQVIFEEAGGVFLNPDGNRTSPFQPEPIIIAPNLDLARQVIDRCLAANPSDRG